MPKVISMKLKDDVAHKTDKTIKKLKMPRNTYINEAFSFFNRQNRRKLLQRQLEKESRRVQKNSLEILEEFENISS